VGLLATTLGRWEAASEHFDAALALHTRMGARTFLANTRHAYADMLLRRGAPGDRDRARELAEQALEAAREIGMARLERLVTPMLADIGAPATPAAGGGARGTAPFGLSTRELEVLRLIAAGHSDRQIAEALFISPRTVGTHVTNILGKLGVHTRAEAAAQGVRAGLA
jgi:DNA-binding CsgD family transcriptional regulator